MPLVVKCDNGSVTDRYLEIIGQATENKFGKARFTSNLDDAFAEPKEHVIVVARTIDAFKLLSRGYKKVIVWFQGVEPEESYMNHKSVARYIVLSLMEKLVLKRAFFRVFVSDEMRRHYENKYHTTFCENLYYCMPCMNTEIHQKAFDDPEKFSNNYFAYIGSMAIWQRFEDTVLAYKRIEDVGIPKCKLFVFTSQKKEAQIILDKYRVKNYSVGFVDNEELPDKLKGVKYGFIIREDNAVNRVATPTKISTYLSCGLIPIYSACLRDFAEIAKDMKYAVQYDYKYVERIKIMSNCCINSSDLFSEYNKIFSTYYCPEFHIKQLEQKLDMLL